jgi:hypothetical protein
MAFIHDVNCYNNMGRQFKIDMLGLKDYRVSLIGSSIVIIDEN